MEADRHARSLGQAGETMVESLIAIAILAIVAVVAYAGLQTATNSSALHKESAVSETLLRTAAEQLQAPTASYEPRAGCDVGEPEPYEALLAYSSLFDDDQIRITEGYGPIRAEVQFWDPASSAPTADETDGRARFRFESLCPANDEDDEGLQEITLSVRTPSHSAERPSVEELVIVKKAR